MTQTTNRFFDEVARLMNDAAGVAQGVRREFETLVKTQTERWLRDLDLVKREEFEVVKDMARLAREENEALKVRLAALEAKLGVGNQSPPTPPPMPRQPTTRAGCPARPRNGSENRSFPCHCGVLPLNNARDRGPDPPGGRLRRFSIR
jgi:BMFP domain-containing protein YqiC